ncbi:MAG TPA: DUF4442 domain-containing protein [Holophagaceae bacterium]|nr:DUF4442 domain-containing protein [Holophagaceae bacterium]
MNAEAMRRSIRNPWKLKLFMLGKLPMGLLAGLRVREFDGGMAAVTIRLGYLTKNPFRSIYFACLAMAAELASGVQGMVRVAEGPPVSMLVVGLEGTFTKKAVGRVTFTCPDGAAIAKAVDETRATGEGRTVLCTSTGRDEAGDEVATFRITWSFKAKGAPPKA